MQAAGFKQRLVLSVSSRLRYTFTAVSGLAFDKPVAHGLAVGELSSWARLLPSPLPNRRAVRGVPLVLLLLALALSGTGMLLLSGSSG